jgi:L-ascorbate metabolism protein UlaG (beta-lactamase superfamily)
MIWILVVLVTIFLAVVAMLTVGILISGPRYKGPVSDHFEGSRFVNPGGAKAKGGLEVFKWMFTRKPPKWKDDVVESYGTRPLTHFHDGIRITFINHSTFLIQVDDVNILTDPVWSKRVSPFRWIGPKRKKHPGIRFEDLPRIHVVLLTHNHYDHLDMETLRTVFVSSHPQIVVPLGVRRFLEDNYISGAIELDWGQSTEVKSLNVACVPAQHFSGRGLLDRDASLWCGYVIKSRAGNIYFSGDTGYNAEMFKKIGESHGPMKVSMLPIGAYKPAWFMAPIHVSPEESVLIHKDVKSATSIAMHFGTFPLADDGREDPVEDLQAAKARLGIEQDEFIVLHEGEARVFE